jgi:hypothetical protein
MEHQPFCNGPLTTVCPVGGYEFGIFKTVAVEREQRTLRSSPAACVAQPEFEDHIRECDSGKRGILEI